MRKLVGSICALALLAPTPASFARQSSDERSEPRAIPPQSDLCRQPAALPRLGKEIERQQNQRLPHRSRTGAARTSVAEAPALMAAPPAPPPPPPPPSPPPPAEMAETASESVVVTATRAKVAEGEAASSDRVMSDYVSPPIMPRPRPRPQPQSGLLTAGEHDDLLNPELYSEYVRNSNVGQVARDIPTLDTERLLTIEAKDSRGQAMPFVPVEVRCANGKSITLQTVADGSSVFFPKLDRLGSRVQVRAGDSRWRSVDLASGNGTQTIGFTLGDRAANVRKLDLALVVDVTGSMSDELRFLQAELTSIVDQINSRHRGLDIRVGFTFYRDRGDEFVTRTFSLDGNIDQAKRYIGQQQANGGGDYPEAMHTAMIRAANQPWRDDAVKSLLLVADAPPHDGDIGMTWRAAEHLRGDRVHIVPVGASGVADTAEYVMRAMAAATQSRYTFLTDDSGIGNPHAKPAIDCYLVTRLDALLRRVIDSQISGRRIEPDRNEIIRSVGKYDAGKCILPSEFSQKRRSKDT